MTERTPVSLVLLVRGPHAADFDDNERGERLQEQHLDHLARMRSDGALLMSGPFQGQPDIRWRGLCVYRTPLDEAVRLARSDPAVQAGRLDVLAMTWLMRRR